MLRRLASVFDFVFKAVSALLLIALLVTVSLGVITRGMDLPLAWTDEISRFLMIWLAVFGWILGTRGRAHVRIRYFHDKLPEGGRRALDLVIRVLMLAFGIAVGWHGVGLTLKNLDLEATTIEISMGWVYAPLVFAGVVTAGQAIVEGLELLGLVGRAEEARS